MKAGIYTRLSHDPEGTSTATQRQEQDCRKLAASKGWEVTTVYRDNDLSAYKKSVRRPDFERMLNDIETGAVDVVIVWRSDRLARQPRDLERVVDACEIAHASLASVTEPFDGGPAGLLMLRMVVAFANHESSVKGERVARKRQEEAESGKWPAGGRRAYGYTPAGRIVPEEAALIEEAARRVEAGESTWRIAGDWIERGVPAPYGGAWNVSNLTRILLAPRIAGLRSYKGEIVATGEWEPILPRARWEALRASLRPCVRRPGSARRHLLTGLLTCGRCGSRLAHNGAGKYVCPSPQEGGCGKLSVSAPLIEDWIGGMVVEALATSKLDALIEQARGLDGAAVMEALRRQEQSLDALVHDHYVEGIIPKAAYLAGKREIEARITDLRRQIGAASPLLARLRSSKLAEEWQAQGTPWRRALLEAALDGVVVDPATKLGAAAAAALPGRLRLLWRDELPEPTLTGPQ